MNTTSTATGVRAASFVSDVRQDDLIDSRAAALQYTRDHHPGDYIAQLARACTQEQSPAAKDEIEQILTNSRMCAIESSLAAGPRSRDVVSAASTAEIRQAITERVGGR